MSRSLGSQMVPQFSSIVSTSVSVLLALLSVAQFGNNCAFALKLIGRVEHSEQLPPLSPQAMPGKIFSPELKASLLSKSTIHKSLVPAWLAGTWQRTRSMEISRVALPSNVHVKPAGDSVAGATDKYGTYKDSQGQVWQVYNPKRAEGYVDRGNFVDYHLVSFYQLVEDGPRSAVVEATATHLVVSKASKKIISVYQDEEINTYTPLADGQVRTDGSVKVFDAKGKPIYLTKSASTESRVAPFENDKLSRFNALPSQK